MVIGGTLFQHKDIHKYNWSAPNGHRNQINHILIDMKWRNSLQDVRVMRSADVYIDHHLLLAKVQSKLFYVKSTGTRDLSTWNKAQLRITDVHDDFCIKTENRFAPLLDEAEEMPIEDLWGNIKEVYNTVSEEVLGRKRHKAPAKWMTSSTWQLIEQRDEVHKKIQSTHSERIKERFREEYKNINKQIKQQVKKDKEQFYESKAEEAQSAANIGNMKTVYDITRELAGHSNKSVSGVRGHDGRIISDANRVAEIWTEHFKTVLNQAEPGVNLVIPATQEVLDILDPPTYICRDLRCC